MAAVLESIVLVYSELCGCSCDGLVDKLNRPNSHLGWSPTTEVLSHCKFCPVAIVGEPIMAVISTLVYGTNTLQVCDSNCVISQLVIQECHWLHIWLIFEYIMFYVLRWVPIWWKAHPTVNWLLIGADYLSHDSAIILSIFTLCVTHLQMLTCKLSTCAD